MKKLVFALAATALLAACSSNNQDAVDNATMNQPAADDLNAMSSDAANDAANAEAEALGTQQQQLEQTPPATTDNGSAPTDADEQNVASICALGQSSRRESRSAPRRRFSRAARGLLAALAMTMPQSPPRR